MIKITVKKIDLLKINTKSFYRGFGVFGVDLNLPSEIWPGQTVNLKAEAVHTN